MVRLLVYFMLTYSVSPRRDATIQTICYFIVGKHHFFKTSVSPRPYTCFQVYALFRYGETTLSACTLQVALATGISTTINQTIEKTKQNKNTKISGSMGSQNHRENQTNQENQDFRING